MPEAVSLFARVKSVVLTAVVATVVFVLRVLIVTLRGSVLTARSVQPIASARSAVGTVVAAAVEAVRRDLVVRMRDSAKMYPDV